MIRQPAGILWWLALGVGIVLLGWLTTTSLLWAAGDECEFADNSGQAYAGPYNPPGPEIFWDVEVYCNLALFDPDTGIHQMIVAETGYYQITGQFVAQAGVPCGNPAYPDPSIIKLAIIDPTFGVTASLATRVFGNDISLARYPDCVDTLVVVSAILYLAAEDRVAIAVRMEDGHYTSVVTDTLGGMLIKKLETSIDLEQKLRDLVPPGGAEESLGAAAGATAVLLGALMLGLMTVPAAGLALLAIGFIILVALGVIPPWVVIALVGLIILLGVARNALGSGGQT